MNPPKHARKLTSAEEKSLFWVLLGTFLEYFDLVLYVHLAVVLNPLFFPSTDPWMAGLLGVFTFSSAYLLRPLGAFVFGYVGDKIGRKASIVWTSSLMGLAALTIAILPSYNAIGFTASVLFILARALQGFSSIGEFIGAQVYTSEIVEKSRKAPFLATLPAITTIIGSMAALGVAMLCLSLDPNNGWRWSFFIGAGVAFIGGLIRLRVMESPAFLEARKKEPTKQDAIDFFRALALRKKNYGYYFGIECITPLSFYFTMRHCSDLLKNLGLSATDVIAHNFLVTLIGLSSLFLCGGLALKYDAFTILKTKLTIGLCLILPLMVLLSGFQTHEGVIFVVQALIVSFLAAPTPAQFQIVHAFPVVGRCTHIGSAYAISHALMYVVTSSCMFFLDQIFGLWGIGALFIVTAAVALFCAHRFTPVEKAPPSEYDRRLEALGEA